MHSEEDQRCCRKREKECREGPASSSTQCVLLQTDDNFINPTTSNPSPSGNADALVNQHMPTFERVSRLLRLFTFACQYQLNTWSANVHLLALNAPGLRVEHEHMYPESLERVTLFWQNETQSALP